MVFTSEMLELYLWGNFLYELNAFKYKAVACVSLLATVVLFCCLGSVLHVCINLNLHTIFPHCLHIHLATSASRPAVSKLFIWVNTKCTNANLHHKWVFGSYPGSQLVLHLSIHSIQRPDVYAKLMVRGRMLWLLTVDERLFSCRVVLTESIINI